MKFNRENYEAYVLDWLEGKLSGHDQELFSIFLKENPDIYSEIMAFKGVQLRPSGVKFPDKNILRKYGNLSNSDSEFGNLCIAFLEGDLESAEKQKFESLLSENPDKLIEFELFRKSRLKPDMNIIFNPRSKLKRLTIYQKRLRIVSAVSAAAVIFLMIIFTRNTDFRHNNLITDSDTNITIPLKTGIIKEEVIPEISQSLFADNRLIKKEIKLSGDSESYREQIEIKPVSSRFSKVENDLSVGLNKLKRTESEPVRDFDSYLTLKEFASNKILGSLFPESESPGQRKISLWEVASSGFEELNQISDGGFALNKEENQKGKLKRISIETPLLGISIPLKNKQPQ